MPKEINWIPPKNKIIIINVGNPLTSSPYNSVLVRINIMYMKANREIKKPNTAEIRNGVVVNEVIPSMAKLNNLK